MRLFIGIQLTGWIRDTLSEVSNVLSLRVEARYVPPSQYHITLAYLGARDEESLPALQTLLDEVASAYTPFSLSLEGLGVFHTSAGAVLYAACSPSDALFALSNALRKRLQLAGETFDPKPLVPHITLARKAKLTSSLPVGIPPEVFTVTALTLFNSVRVEGILQYVPVYNAPLRR